MHVIRGPCSLRAASPPQRAWSPMSGVRERRSPGFSFSLSGARNEHGPRGTGRHTCKTRRLSGAKRSGKARRLALGGFHAAHAASHASLPASRGPRRRMQAFEWVTWRERVFGNALLWISHKNSAPPPHSLSPFYKYQHPGVLRVRRVRRVAGKKRKGGQGRPTRRRHRGHARAFRGRVIAR